MMTSYYEWQTGHQNNNADEICSVDMVIEAAVAAAAEIYFVVFLKNQGFL